MIISFFIISILWITCRSDQECTSTISNTSEIIFTCLSEVIINELPLYNYTTDELANITSIVVNGINETTTGPFTSIPPNICLLPNLESIDFSNNRIEHVDPWNVLSGCLSNVITLDVSYNNISEFPSVMIYNMATLKNLYFQHNKLIDVPGNAFRNVSHLEIVDFSYNYLTNFEFWVFGISISADFSYNQISMITNKYFYDIPSNTFPDRRKFILNNNSPSINLTDAVYEMYNSCDEVIEKLEIGEDSGTILIPGLSYSLVFVDFGTTQINCNCDQSYIIQVFISIFARIEDMLTFPIYNATCLGSTEKFVYSTCPTGIDPANSSVDFSTVYPRQCMIREDEDGNLTNVPSINIPIANISIYPHYETKLMNPGACFFTFINLTSVRIKCTSDLSTSSTIPSDLLTSVYFSNINQIDFTYSISSLPLYLCSLPSRNIDLSFQSFTILDDQTFPCLDWFHTVKLSFNRLISVNIQNGDFKNLNILDLSSNYLTQIPYSILNPTPTSLYFLDLRNNSITLIDLFYYTRENITIDLRDNPFNTSMIINPQNITLTPENNDTSTANITYPPSVTNSTYILNDQTALTAGTCNRITVLLLRDILQTTFNNILLDCTCSSITLRDIFLRSGSNITDEFSCVNQSLTESFYTLTMASCESSAVNFSSGLCYNESLQSNLTIFITSNQFYTNSPEFQQTDFDWNISQINNNNNSNQLSTISIDTITSKDTSYSEVTSSLSSILFINNATTPIFDDSIMTDMAWTTTTTSTTTSVSTSSSTSTSSTSETSTSTTSTSTSTTSSTTSVTTSTSSTTSTTGTSTSTTSSTTSVTTSTSSTTSTTDTSTTSSSSTSTTSTTVTSTSSTSTSTTSVSTTTTTTVSTSVTTTTNSNINSDIIQSDDSGKNQTGLIVGVVLGVVGGLAIIGGGIAVIAYKKSQAAKAASTMDKPVGRAVMISQTPSNSLLQSRPQPRSLRAVRLAPLPTKPSLLPPILTTAKPTSSFNNPNASITLRGIPLQTDPIRSPTNIMPQYIPDSSTFTNDFSGRPINNPPVIQQPLTQQQFQEPKVPPRRLHQTLNIGGDTPY